MVSVTDQLIEYIRLRQEKGIETYGVSLQTFNGRDSLQDAIDEHIDEMQYLFQWKLEREYLLERIQRLEAELNR